MIRGYSVEEAARVLGIPIERVWDLVARGVFSGARGEDGAWRVNLGGSTTEGADTQPPAPDGSGPMPDARPASSGVELSPFRELLTEFRHLTERYGQALLALGEARGEVASLNARVDALETRIDLRLPYAGAAATDPAVSVPPVEVPRTDEPPAVIATPLPVEPDVRDAEQAPAAGSDAAAPDEPVTAFLAEDDAADAGTGSDGGARAIDAEEMPGAVADEVAPHEADEGRAGDASVAVQQAGPEESEAIAAVAETVEEVAVSGEGVEAVEAERRADEESGAPEEPAPEETETASAPDETETASEPDATTFDAEPTLPDVDLPQGELPSNDDEFETIDDLLVLAEGDAAQDGEPAAADVTALGQEPAAEEELKEEPAAEDATGDPEEAAAVQESEPEEEPAAEEAPEEEPAAEPTGQGEEPAAPDEAETAESEPAAEEAPEEEPAAEPAAQESEEAPEGEPAAEQPAQEEPAAPDEADTAEPEPPAEPAEGAKPEPPVEHAEPAEEADAIEVPSGADTEPALDSEPAQESELAQESEPATESGLPDDGAFAIEEDRTQRRRNNRLSEEIAAALARADDPSPPELPNGTDQTQHAPHGDATEPAAPTQVERAPAPLEPSRQWPPFARRTEAGEEPLLWIGRQPDDEPDYAAEMEVGSAGWQTDASSTPAPHQNAAAMAADDLGSDPYPDQAELIDALGWEQDEVEAIRSLLAGRTPQARETWPPSDPDVRQPTAEESMTAQEPPAEEEPMTAQEPPAEEEPMTAQEPEAQEEPMTADEPPDRSSWPSADRPPDADTASPTAAPEGRRFELPGAADLDEALAALRRRSSEEAAAEEGTTPTDRSRTEPPAADGESDAPGDGSERPAAEPADTAQRPPTRPGSGLEDPAWSRRSPAANAYRRLRRFLGG
ncbi:MAG: hypothetical protein ABI534_06495 [Chloroflexota bacterium]